MQTDPTTPTSEQLANRTMAVNGTAQPIGTNATDASGKSVFVGNPGLNPNFNYSPNTPGKEVTALSSTNISNNVIPQNNQQLDQLANKGITIGADGVSRHADGTIAPTYTDQSGNVRYGYDPQDPSTQGQLVQAPSNAQVNADGTSTANGKQFGTIPDFTGFSYNGKYYAGDPNINNLLAGMMQNLDAQTKQAVDSITQKYTALKTEQADINARQTAQVSQTLLMGGSSRYAQLSSEGAMTTIMSYGLQKIANLDNQETDLITKAKQAQAEGNFKVLGEALTQAKELRATKIAETEKLNDRLIAQQDKLKEQKLASDKDTAIAGEMSKGITDPSQILANLKDSGLNITSKDIEGTMSNLNPQAKEVANLITEAVKNNPNIPQEILKSAGQAKDLNTAISLLGKYLSDPTSNAGQYQTAVSNGYKGTYQDWFAAKTYKDEYNKAFASESAKSAFVGSSANQQKLEQQYRNVLLKEVSNRSGGLGLQDQKVNQAVHLRALMDQYKDKDGNYNVPAVQYAELAMGLGNLLSSTNAVSDSAREAITQRTAAGDLAGAVSYLTGTPQKGTTQDVLKNLYDSINRQGSVAEDLRDQAVQFLHGLAPTDLEPSRIQALEKNTLASFTNPSQNVSNMTPEQIDQKAVEKVAEFASNPENKKAYDLLKTQFPNKGATWIAQQLHIDLTK